MLDKIKRWVTWVLLKVLQVQIYNRADRKVFRAVTKTVSNDVTIPVYGSDQPRFGKEARRDRAFDIAECALPHLSDSERILGCEIAYRLGKKYKAIK